MDEGAHALHVVLHFVHLVLDDLFFDRSPAAASSSAAVLFLLLLGLIAAFDQLFLHFAVRAVGALLLLGLLDLALEADGGGFRPAVLLEGGLVLGQRLPQGGHFLLRLGLAGIRTLSRGREAD